MQASDAPPSLFKTTAIRLAVRYVLAYATALLLAIGAVSWSTVLYSDSRAKSQLRREVERLTPAAQATPVSTVRAALERRLPGAQKDKQLYLLVAPDGMKLAGNLLAWPTEEPIDADGEIRTLEIEEEVLPAEWFDDDAFLPVIAISLDSGHRLLVSRGVGQARALQGVTEFLREGLGLAVPLALAMGLTLAFAIRRRIGAITTTATSIMSGELSRRVPVSARHDEFDALAGSLNAMLDRIAQLLRGMREVTDSIAHDLRSPLTRLRSRLEVTLLEPRSESEYREVLAQSVEDTDALIRTFNALLEIAQAEAGHLNGEQEAVDLAVLAHDLVELYAPLAEARGQTLEMPASVVAIIPGSRKLLAQAIGNLIENAIKYAPDDSPIRVNVRRVDGTIELGVMDRGPGIPERERARVLERFVRLDCSRHTAGNGLGLSLVKAVATLHNADILLSDANPGLIATLRFSHIR